MEKKKKSTAEVGDFMGKLFSFNTSIKLYHWHVTGPGSYAQHIAIDQALEDMNRSLDSIVETTYALVGDISITVPETKLPKNIVKHVSDFYNFVKKERELFTESFSESILDDYQQAMEQLLYRLKRLQ